MSLCAGTRWRVGRRHFKLLRSAKDAPLKGQVAIAGRNPEAIWFSDYTDRVIFDELGLFDEYIELERKKAAAVAQPRIEAVG